MLRVLLTNDDGVLAPGLRALAQQLGQWCKVTVMAPSKPRSATSHSITLHKPLRITPVEDGWPEYAAANVKVYACSGTPSDCTMLGILHQLADAPPDLVISGINDGMNVAQDLTYSGTVGGALEGAVLGVPSIAASLVSNEHITFPEAAELLDAVLCYLVYGKLRPEQAQFEQVLRLPRAAQEPRAALEHGEVPWLPSGLSGQICLNINMPDIPLAEVQGLQWTRAGHRTYEDVVSVSRDPNGREYYWIGGSKLLDENLPGSDTLAISRGFVSITPISYDITQYADLGKLEPWFAERYSLQGGHNRHDER